MRIPSSLSDDNLYRRHHRHVPSSSVTRRLLRLGLAMVLVIVVMRQAGNPRIYESFFGEPAPDKPVAGLSGEGRHRGGAVQPLGPADWLGNSAPPALLDTLRQVVDSLGDQNVGELMVLVDNALADDMSADVAPESSTESTSGEPGASPLSADQAQIPRKVGAPLPGLWVERLSSALEQAAVSAGLARNGVAVEPIELDWSDRETLVAVRFAMDRWALGRVDQSSVWKGPDRLAFYRFMKIAPATQSGDRPARASVVSLLQQPDVYLNRSVAVTASVARAIPHEGTDNPFGIEKYWELWLRPRDGSERPLVLFVSEVSAEIRQVGPDASLADGPAISAEGVYLKRLTYRSASGSELAPAIVGRAIALRAEPSATVSLRQAAGERPGGWGLVVISAAAGLVIGFLVFVRSRQHGKRIRALRRAAQPPTIEAFRSNDDARQRVDGGVGQVEGASE
jgi:hypothetical protein